jgi:hypothetical protein
MLLPVYLQVFNTNPKYTSLLASTLRRTDLQIFEDVLAGLVQLILVEDNVEHLGRTLGQLLSRHQLHVDVSRLRLRRIKEIVSRDGKVLFFDSGLKKRHFLVKMLLRRIKGFEKYYC